MGNEPTLKMEGEWLSYYGNPGCQVIDKESKETYFASREGFLCPIIKVIKIEITLQHIIITSKIGYQYHIPHTPKVFHEWQEIARKQWGNPYE